MRSSIAQSCAIVTRFRRFPLPDLPKGWTPDPRRVWEKDKENLSGDAAHVEPVAKLGKGRGKSELTAGEVRNFILVSQSLRWFAHRTN